MSERCRSASTARPPRRLRRCLQTLARLVTLLAAVSSAGLLLTAQTGVTVSPTTWNVGGEGGVLAVSVTAPGETGWTATSDAPWLTVPIGGVMVSTFVGSTEGFADGVGTAARFWGPVAAAVDASGTVYVADSNNHCIRRVTPAGLVTTLAGWLNSGDADGTGSDARFHFPGDIAIEPNGNLVVADRYNHRIRRVTPDGVVTTIAGSTAGSADGQGTEAQFSYPTGLAIDADGGSYVADRYNHRIRKITPAGLVTTLAGSSPGTADGTGAAARFTEPTRIAIDAEGNLLVSDSTYGRIRKVTPGGVVTTVAGLFPGDADGPAAGALFNYPAGLAFDAFGHLHIADVLNHKVKTLSPAGIVTTLVGAGRGTADGPAETARFDHPSGLAFSAHGVLYVTDSSHRVRTVTVQQGQQTTGTGPGTLVLTAAPQTSAAPRVGTVTIDGQAITVTQAGGTPSFSLDTSTWSPKADGGTATVALTSSLADVPWSATSSEGWLSVDPAAGVGSAALTLTVTPNPSTSARVATATVAGRTIAVTQRGVPTFDVSPTSWSAPPEGGQQFVAVTAAEPDDVWTAVSHALWLVVPTEVAVASTLAGTTSYGSADGSGAAARFDYPGSVAVDAAGTLYVADRLNHRIRKVTPDGVVSTLAGSEWGYADGPGATAQFCYPIGVAVDLAGNVYVADSGNERIRKITPDGMVSTLAGSVTGDADGAGADARFNTPRGVAVDASGLVYVADQFNSRIRKITPEGVVTTLAGSHTGEADGVGTAAQFSFPAAVALDAAGVIYVADTGNARIRRVTPSGAVTTLAGSTPGFADGAGTAARFDEPIDITVDAAGRVYVADRLNHRIRNVTPSGVVGTVAGLEAGYADGEGGNVRFSRPSGIAVNAAGRIYIADQQSLIREMWLYDADVPGGTGSNAMKVAVQPQTSIHPRVGTLTIAGRTVTVAQDGGVPDFSIDRATWTPVASESSTRVGLATSLLDAPWAATSDVAWLSVLPAVGTGPAVLTLSVAANTSAIVRTGTVVAAGQTIVVEQSPPGSAFVPSGSTFRATVQTARGLVEMTFTNVTAAGTVMVEAAATDPRPLGYTPPGHRLVPTTTYFVTGSPVFESLTLCVPYDLDELAAVGVLEANAKLFRQWWQAFEWQGVTTGVDVANQRVCGLVDSLAPLAVGGLVEAGPSRATWYLAEGATGDFDMDIAIGNLEPEDATVRITWVLPAGTTPVAPTIVPMSPHDRKTVRVNDIPGLEHTAVSAIVENVHPSARDIVVERSMYWRHQGQRKGHNSPGVLEPATTWYLAEGATGDFNDFVLIANPDASRQAEVHLTFLRDNGTTVGPITRRVAAGQRETVWVNHEVPELAVASFSTRVESANGVPIIVERSMYFPSASATFPGPVGHQSSGVTSLSTRWIFGEGVTGGVPPNPVFDTFLLLANPGSTRADVRVIYAKDSGERFEQTVAVDPGLSMPPTSRKTIWVNHEIPGFAAAAFSMEVLSDVPILAERAVYWGDGTPATWREAHNSPGATAEATAWTFAEGLDGAVDSSGTPYQSYFLVANTNPTEPLELLVFFFRDDGVNFGVDYKGTASVPPGARFTIASWQFPMLNGHRFATSIESLNGTAFVAERAVYWGAGFAGGHASLGTPGTSPMFGPPPPP